MLGGIILYFIGSETVETEYDVRKKNSAKDVVCAACDQYLGQKQNKIIRITEKINPRNNGQNKQNLQYLFYRSLNPTSSWHLH